MTVTELPIVTAPAAPARSRDLLAPAVAAAIGAVVGALASWWIVATQALDMTITAL